MAVTDHKTETLLGCMARAARALSRGQRRGQRLTSPRRAAWPGTCSSRCALGTARTERRTGRVAGAVWSAAIGSPEPPQQIINEDIYVLNDGAHKVEFRHYGWGHTRGDGYVYLPKEQVLCTGDAVVNGPFNNLRDANIANWPDILAKVGKLKIKYVLPGHGMMGGRELLAGQEQFLRDLYQAVKKGVDRGLSLEEIQAGLKLPEVVKPWVSSFGRRRAFRLSAP